jgi:hypothetical protein
MTPTPTPTIGETVRIRPPGYQRGISVKIRSKDSWMRGDGTWVHAFRGELAAGGELWSFTLDTIVHPAIYTQEFRDRLARILPYVPEDPFTVDLLALVPRVSAHYIAVYSLVKSLHPCVQLTAGPEGHVHASSHPDYDRKPLQPRECAPA